MSETVKKIYTGHSGQVITNKYGTWDTSVTDPKHVNSPEKNIPANEADGLMAPMFVGSKKEVAAVSAAAVAPAEPAPKKRKKAAK